MPDDVAAEWLGDKEEKGVVDQLQTPGAEGPKQNESLYVLEALDDVAAEWLGDKEKMGVVDQLQTPGAEGPKRDDGKEVSAQHLTDSQGRRSQTE